MSYLRDSTFWLGLALLVIAVAGTRVTCTPDMPPAPPPIKVILREPPQQPTMSEVREACAEACRETQPCDLWAESDEPPQRPWQELRDSR